jgi:hypothetical protein
MGQPFACASAARPLVRGCSVVALALVLVACGGGSSTEGVSASTGNESPAGAVQPGEVPPELLFAEPRPVDQTSKLALAWSSESAFTGAITAQIWFGVNFSAGPVFELQHNGAPAFYVVTDFAGDEARFEMRYADGFFVLTAERDSTNDTMNFLVAITPSGVSNENPEFLPRCTGNDSEPCVHGSINNGNWPKRAGGQATLLIPRADPAMLSYSVLVKPNADADFAEFAAGLSGQSAVVPRGPARQLDFDTARAKVRGCNTAGECIESVDQPLQAALLKGVIGLAPSGPAPNGHVALSADGKLLAVKVKFANFPTEHLQIYGRDPRLDDRWSTKAQAESAAPGFGRTFALSGDGSTLAVEASPCSVITVVCTDSTVIVYRAGPFGATYDEQARFIGARAPKLSHDGNRLLAIAVSAQRGADAIVSFARNGEAWNEQAVLAVDYTPLDLALSADGTTLAVARQGTRSNPCGCRAVVVYDGATPAGWIQRAVLHSNKRLDTVGSANDDGFGFVGPTTHSLALSADGSVIAVGASLDSSDASDALGDPNNRGALNSGAVYIFGRQGNSGTWLKEAFIKARGATAHDHFGHAVALDANGTLLYGGARGLAGKMQGVNHNHAPDQVLPPQMPGAGGALTGAAAYAFESTSGAWTQRAAAVAPNANHAAFGTHFGLALSADGATLALGTGEPPASGSSDLTRRVFVY